MHESDRELFLMTGYTYVKNYRNRASGAKAIGDSFEDLFLLTKGINNFLIKNPLVSRRNTYNVDGMKSLSGFNHELDMVFKGEKDYFLLEFKHYYDSEINKNEF